MQLELLATSPSGADFTPWLYLPRYLDSTTADRLLAHSLADICWVQNQMSMYGKTLMLPRKEAIVGNALCSYSYAGVTLTPEPWSALLQGLRDRLELEFNCKFSIAIGNYYADGNQHIGWHADDSRELGLDPTIASISLGASRKFQLRLKEGGKPETFELGHGDLFVMLPGCQRSHKHRLVQQKGLVGERVNWTFRPHIAGGF